IKTRSWIFILRAGTFDPDQLEDDVAALRRYYLDKGFFDVRVGRKVIVSPDQTEMQIDFTLEEGRRYTIEKVSLAGNQSIPESKLRENLKLSEGQPWDNDLL